MSYRPPSGTGMRPGSRGGIGMARQGPAVVPPGTASRLTTGMAGGGAVPVAGGVALSTNVQVDDRPMTRQGLGGLKTGALGGRQRQVQDKTYFLGVLRTKIQELNAEISRLKKEVDTTAEDQSNYVSYEKRAESLAAEIRDLQAALGDYNTLVDKMNTDESIGDIQMDYEELKSRNDREATSLDSVFEQKQQREQVIKQLEIELQQERSLTETLVADMNPKMRQKYMQLKDQNEHLLKTLETDQQEVDRLTMKKKELEDELAVSPVKQEAVRLYEQLQELEEKRDQLIKEQKEQGSPQEERERLLKQVKENNQEIASMERQSNEIKDRILHLQEEIQQLDMDIDENQALKKNVFKDRLCSASSRPEGPLPNKPPDLMVAKKKHSASAKIRERNQKYRELKKREEGMDEFLNSYDENRRNEVEKMGTLEQNIVLLLEHMSRNLARFTHLPTSKELSTMKEDLAFKETEMKKSENTASGLAGESQKLADDLTKVEQLEAKITLELETLKEKTNKMEDELLIYNDLDKLKMESESKKKKLGEDKVILHKRRETFKKIMQQMTTQYDALKAQLNDNETYAQLGNLERKWQHHEQNNFVMKEFIAAKTMESDFQPLAKKVSNMVAEYNKYLQENTGKTNY